jgi:FAD/FMN-containing dehydrogenase/Fe-S oxidoreductase
MASIFPHDDLEMFTKNRESRHNGSHRKKKDQPSMDAHALAEELKGRIQGDVRFDNGSRALYATDASNYRQVPIGVVLPRSAADIVETIAVCRQFGAPVLSRGGGTSLAGQGCNLAVVMDMSRYFNHILEIDAARKFARVEPGLVLDDLRNAAEKHHLTFGPDPATHSRCTLGGMIGNNSCGVHSVMAGKTVDNVEELEILTYDGLRMWVGPASEEELQSIIAQGGRRGEIYLKLKQLRDRYADLIRARYPDIPRRVSGYNLDQLLPENGFHVARALVGSESTCVTVLQAKVRLVYSPPTRSLLVLGYPDVYTAGDHILEILDHKPVGLEGMDDRLISYMRKKELHPTDIDLLPEGGGWLLVEFGGENEQEADGKAHDLMDALKKKNHPPTMKLYDNKAQEERVWTIRESGLGATANVPGMQNTWPGWEDAAVPPAKLGGYLRDFRQLLDDYNYHCALYGHFGQGCVHVRIDFDLRTRRGIDKYLAFINEAADLVVQYGGSLSGEHGDGQSRAALLPKMFGEELVHAFEEFKLIWDPQRKMNPGKLVFPYQPDQNLRLGTGYNPWEPRTFFQFPNDQGSFAHATLRCVGVGKCRRERGGTMCPSYMVTREEKHSTRGRARLLFEMLQGQEISDGWRDENVREALDLCLACKGCKGDCPVNVDMATYKAEFLSHYYKGRLRPRAAYAFGLIDRWAWLAAYMPGLANLFTQTPVLRGIAKQVAGVAPQRKIPAFASKTFKAWFRQRPLHNQEKPPVILWPDTFNNYFYPDTAKAAVEVLEAAGFRVIVPQQRLCCGRPLYDWGMLNRAKSYLLQVLEALKVEIENGVPMVGLEPSCTSVFRDEMVNLFPSNQDAIRLRQQTYTLGEFLSQKAPQFPFPKLERKAIIQGHCHHKAIMRMYGEEDVLSKLNLNYDLLDSGCCGMAGAFGFEKGEHYEVSIKAGERVLLPAVRNAARDTLIIADGFSCREQIVQTTGREALHLAQIIQMAMRKAYHVPQKQTSPRLPTLPKVGLFVGGFLAGGALSWFIKHRNKP